MARSANSERTLSPLCMNDRHGALSFLQDKLVINTCSSAIPQQEWHFAHYGTQDS
eukprot:m.237948 g.237948  ORF g.237948 m.237948 type:complete len:55 (+) comp54341_c0_seq8:1837-2001(+)